VSDTHHRRVAAALRYPISQVFVQNECRYAVPATMRSQPLPCASQLTYVLSEDREAWRFAPASHMA
jgi:hypothetical protein